MKIIDPKYLHNSKIFITFAYNNKIEELVEQRAYPTKEDAEKDNPYFEMNCEIYYEKDYGLFAVESGAVESGTVYSPYSGELCDSSETFS